MSFTKSFSGLRSDYFSAVSLRIVFWVGLISIYCIAWMMQSHLFIRSDISILMHEAEKLLSGGKYVKDFYETDPPLILFLNFPALLLMKGCSLSIFVAWRIYVFFLATATLFICGNLLKKILVMADARLPVLILLAIAAIFLILPLGDFGQRDHLYFIFTLPYLLLLTLQLQNKTIGGGQHFFIGLLGAVGFAIKPHYLATWVLLELFLIFKTKRIFAWLRVESLTVILFMLIYLASIFIFYPEYVFGMVPLVSKIYYSGFGNTWNDMLSYANSLYCLAAFFFFWVCYANNSQKILSWLLLLGLAGNLIAFMAQDTAWYYHVLPAFSMAILLLILLFSLFVLDVDRIRKVNTPIVLFSILLFLFLVVFNKSIWVSIIFFPYGFFGLFFILFFVLFYLSAPKINFFKVMSATVLIIVFGGGFTYFARHTDWYAHRFSLTILLMFLMFSLLISRENSKRITFTMTAWMGALLFAYPLYESNIVYNYYLYYTQKSAGLVSFLKANAENKSVYFISSQVAAYPFIDYANVSYVSKYPLLIWVPSIVKGESANLEPIAKANLLKDKSDYINSIGEELDVQKPAFVFVDVKKFAFEKIRYNFIQNFSQNSQFRAAWQNYMYFTTVVEDPLYRFAVYKRKIG